MPGIRKKILLVDDTATVRMLERAILGSEFDYVEAQNGAEALQAALQHHPDLVLMDINMPVKDGIEGLHDLKQEPATRNIPVIIITSEPESAKKELCLRLGCAAFLAKPLDKVLLKEAVRRQLQR